jgi:hypothetical protein
MSEASFSWEEYDSDMDVQFFEESVHGALEGMENLLRSLMARVIKPNNKVKRRGQFEPCL